MSRFVETALKIAPLARQAWPILLAIVAIISDAFGATSGAATSAAVGLLAGGNLAGRRLAAVDAVEAFAAPLRPLGDVAEVPVFEFHPTDRPGRHYAAAVSLHGRKYSLENGPGLFIEGPVGDPGPDGPPGPSGDDYDFLDEDLDDEDLDEEDRLTISLNLDDEPLDDEPTPDRA